MPVLGLFNYRKFLFSTPESADSENFSGSKVVYFTSVEDVRNFTRVISRNSARVQNYSNCLLALRKKISSAFRVQKM